MPINRKALLEYWLTDLTEAGSSPIFVNTHFHMDIVETFLKRECFSNHINILREPDLLGTAGTIVELAPKLKDIPTIVAHSDNWTNVKISELLKAHVNLRPSYCPITMVSFTPTKKSQCGMIQTNEHNVVTHFEEKPKTTSLTRANAAVYVIEPEVIKWMVDNKAKDFSNDVLPHFINRIFVFGHLGVHKDIGTISLLVNSQYDNSRATLVSEKDDWQLYFEEHVIHGLLNAEVKKLAN